MLPSRALLRLAPLALCAAGCADEQTGLDRVLHLDPRLADGASPTLALSGGRAPLATRLDIGEPGPWELDERDERLVLRLTEPFPADAFSTIELYAEGTREAPFRATWTSAGEPREARGAFRPTPKPTRLSLRLEQAPGWSGEITGLALDFGPEPPFRILEAVLKSAGFEPGWCATEDGGDAGLIALGPDASRAWPTDVGVPLFVRVTVPADARLAARVGVRSGPRVRLAVAARAAAHGANDDADWTELATVEAGRAWTPLAADLSALAGEDVELCFLASPLEGPARVAGDVPQLGNVLLGEPRVVPAESTPEADDADDARRPSFVVITLDTLRADALDRGFTPNLEALAARGARFDEAFATTNSTVPSHASLFTGLKPVEHGAIGNRYAFGADNDTAAERLRALGYHTAAAVSVNLLRPGFGFGQGFDRFELPHAGSGVDGEPATAAAERFLAERADDGAPFFLWLHLFDAHTPYGPPDAFADAFVREHGLTPPPREAEPATMPVWDVTPSSLEFARGASNVDWMRFRYHLGVAHADMLVGRLLARLEDGGLAEHTLVTVTADHGESFGERDFWFEHANVYPEVLRVPLILAGPGVPSGARVGARVSGVDLLPTLLRSAGRPDPELGDVDLLELASTAGSGERDTRRLWFQLADGLQAGYRDRAEHFVATIGDGLRWIDGAEVDGDGARVPRFAGEPRGTLHLFDLASDPDALHDIATAEPERAARAAATVEEWLATRVRARASKAELTADDERLLQALGYIDSEAR